MKKICGVRRQMQRVLECGAPAPLCRTTVQIRKRRWRAALQNALRLPPRCKLVLAALLVLMLVSLATAQYQNSTRTRRGSAAISGDRLMDFSGGVVPSAREL